IRCALDSATYGGNSGTVAGDTGQSTPRGPAAVPVHDDGDVQTFRECVLHRKATAHLTSSLQNELCTAKLKRKKIQTRAGTRPRANSGVGSSLVPFAASRTT